MGKHFNNIFATLGAMVASLLSLRVEHTKYATKYRFALMPLFRPEKNNRVLFANVNVCGAFDGMRAKIMIKHKKFRRIPSPSQLSIFKCV